MQTPLESHIEYDLPIDDEPEFCRFVGMMTARWASIESELANSLGHMLYGNRSAARTILYSLGSFKARLDVVRAMAEEHVPNGPEKDAFLTILAKISKLHQSRNRILHSQYFGISGGLMREFRAPGTRIPVERVKFGMSEMRDHVRVVEQLLFRLSVLNSANPKEWRWRDPVQLLALR